MTHRFFTRIRWDRGRATNGALAWYQATNASVGNKTYANTGAQAITTNANTFSAGYFDVQVSVAAAANNLAYTDAAGLTAYYVGSSSQLVSDVAIPDGQIAEATDGSVTITITYRTGGDLEGNDTAIQAAWNQMGLTKFAVTLTGSNGVKLAQGNDHAYAGTKNGSITLSNLSLGTVAFSDGAYSNTIDDIFSYAIAGEAQVQSQTTNGTITASEASLS